MNLPRGYNRRLQRWDSQLRMRWSETLEEWVLERKAAYGRLDLDPAFLCPDTFTQMRDGYFTLGTYPPRDLPTVDRLISYLQFSDLWNNGMTVEEMQQYMDDRWLAAHLYQKQKRRELMGDLHQAANSYIAWRSGERVTVPA